MLRIITSFSTYTLLVALFISAISAYYSIIGLTAIFSAAVTSIIIMGIALELGKLAAAVWLKLNWSRASWLYKVYLVPAVAFLMMLTSMGIFGYLSKAHSDHGLVGGDVQAKIALYDERIKVSRDNIETNRRVLKQMDEAVEQVLGRSTTEQGAARSATLRRQQTPERNRLLKEIADEQAKITAINEESAVVRAQIRKVEAEVGPIRYIAALIYGDNPDATLLESAVRWVIIMIVIVFDPLALVLILAAQQSWRWESENRKKNIENSPEYPKDDGSLSDDQLRQIRENVEPVIDDKILTVKSELTLDKPVITQDKIEEIERRIDELTAKSESWTWTTTIPAQPISVESEKKIVRRKKTSQPTQSVDSQPVTPQPEAIIETSGITRQIITYDDTGYVNYEGKLTSVEALKEIRPDLVLALQGKRNMFSWGDKFPSESLIGDISMRTDVRPHKLYKFNGTQWIPVDKSQNSSYLNDERYLQFIIESLNNFQYLPEMLTEAEEEAIRNILSKAQ